MPHLPGDGRGCRRLEEFRYNIILGYCFCLCDGEQQLEKNAGKCEVFRGEFDGWFEGGNQLGLLGRHRNPSLFPLGQAISRPQTTTIGKGGSSRSFRSVSLRQETKTRS